MQSEKRREKILEVISKSQRPITGTHLAGIFNVSRQVIVQDIAILRAAGEEIIATPQGYMIPSHGTLQRYQRIMACRHLIEGMEDELMTVVDLGGTVIDVIVEHAIYGEYKARLMIASPSDVRKFMQKMKSEGTEQLSLLTDGIHLHTIEAASPDILDDIEKALDEKGVLIEPEE